MTLSKLTNSDRTQAVFRAIEVWLETPGTRDRWVGEYDLFFEIERTLNKSPLLASPWPPSSGNFVRVLLEHQTELRERFNATRSRRPGLQQWHYCFPS